MGSFRNIQPAPSLTPKSLPRERPSPALSLDSVRRKRFKSVTQACETCRHHKARCDGGRPRCGGCQAKGRSCRYQGEEGQSRQAALKAELENLKKLRNDLTNKPLEEAQQILAWMRKQADDSSSMSGEDGRSVASSSQPLLSSSSSSLLTPSPMPTPSTASPGSVLTNTSQTSPLPPRKRSDPAASLVPALTRAAIQSFYSSSGKLFHVFTREQTDEYFKTVFNLNGSSGGSRELALCCLASVAAVGVQYNPTEFEMGSDVMYYDLAEHYFSEVAVSGSPDVTKVCAMMALYNVLVKSTTALGYIEMGMVLSRKYKINPRFSYTLPRKECPGEDYRRTWRTLLFLAGWLSSTLGYLSGSIDHAFDQAFQDLVPIAPVEGDYACQVGEIVQDEMTGISLVNAEILRRHLSREELSSRELYAALQTLEQWYWNLAPQIRLSKLSDQVLEPIVRRSLFHIHLLHLGAYILLYRRIASQVFRFERGDESPWTPQQQSLMAQAERGIIAAKHSASILGLLLAEDGVFRRCWLVIFQSHTTCAVLLHSVTQKQIHGFPPSAWEDELKQAQLCLDALEFCGKADSVALRFHTRLSAIHNTLAQASPKGADAMRRTDEWVSIPPDFPPLHIPDEHTDEASEKALALEYLFRVPAATSPQMKAVAFSLFSALCRPYRESTEEVIKTERQGSEESADSVDGLRWDYHRGSSFAWDTSGIGLGEVDGAGLGRFIDSEEPSGWSLAPDMEVSVEDVSVS
ncbi:nitrogen assimilation transcription factor nit-4 [Echria macrotheca]|uniref:Nitrogen assimilation transcription factor nit-4 n=1 Tax=Echria macrotheca TaxID=438768 RepID=A0AAJ0B805_9PEZI|nr:nitrogen assimilation transcription factor nit-4 [Echria macrotheca]